jgi:tetratricopeptide (TPR) repeat protein
MGLFDKIMGAFADKEPIEEDFYKIAKDFEDKGLFVEAIKEYEKLILTIYAGKDATKYSNVTKKLIELYMKLGNYDKILELWPKQYAQEDYGPRQKLELALLMEKAGKNDAAMDIYNSEGIKLQIKKIEFLMRQKKIDDANAECTRLLLSLRANDPQIIPIWMLKGKILMGIRRWEEAYGYFLKVIDKDNSNLDAKKFKNFCAKQINS